MRVMITGGAGLIGRALAAHLLERGFTVHLTDLVPETDTPHTSYAQCDITDFAAVRAQVRGCDAIVHLAALRNPLYAPGPDVYRVNTVGTFNVFEAAALEGLHRVVQASSINAIGCAWNIRDFEPQYFPIDEDHPLATSDPYSLSKEQSETLGAYYWRRAEITSVALRLPGIYAPEQRNAAYNERRTLMCQFLDELISLPDAERERQLAEVRARTLEARAARALEYPATSWPVGETLDWAELLWRAYMVDRFNLWASLDVRDAAVAIELALTAAYTGSHPLFINDSQNSLGYESETLLRLFFPEVLTRRQPLIGAQALVSLQRAQDLLGFTPHYSRSGDQHAETR